MKMPFLILKSLIPSQGDTLNALRVACLLVFLTFGASLPACTQQAPAFGAAHDGITIDCGTFGRFTLTYPALDTGGDKPLLPVETTVAGSQAKLKYAGDAEVDVSVEPDGRVSYVFSHPPASLKTYRVSMLIDAGFSQGGKWQIGSGDNAAFPVEKPSKPHLFQGNAGAFTLTNFEGKRLAFEVPPFSYEEITDNREWGWKIFNWMFIAPFDKNNPHGVMTVREDTSGAKPVVVADRFGQDAALDFPGKVKSESELKQDVTRDAAVLRRVSSAAAGYLRRPAAERRLAWADEDRLLPCAEKRRKERQPVVPGGPGGERRLPSGRLRVPAGR